MPINNCSIDGKPGYKWGNSGACYGYTQGDKKSMTDARKKALAQAASMGEFKFEKTAEELALQLAEDVIDLYMVQKSLTQWFKEKWVDLSRPKAGGGFEPCGRADASSGKYPKCVPAARAARMTPEQIASAIRRKRTAESSQTRQDKKPINVSTEVEKVSRNVPTNPALYARVKAEAKAKFDVYPSAYANAWLVREYKKRGGGYRTVSKSIDSVEKVAEDLAQEEAVLADMLTMLANLYGKFNEDQTGIWAGYDSPEENDVKDIGVKCSNCVLYDGNGVCKIIAQKVEEEGKCRFAIIPDGIVDISNEDYEDS
jgi:hypothetical protein